MLHVNHNEILVLLLCGIYLLTQRDLRSWLDCISQSRCRIMSFYLMADKRYPLIPLIKQPTTFATKKRLKVQSCKPKSNC